MKTKSLVAVAALVLVLSACDENDPSISDGDDVKPEPTQVGFPNGMPVSKTVGSGGGSVSIAGEVEIEIPAGALSADTEISIQPISNNAPNGNGNAYRLGPDNVNFSKPVKLTFPCTETVDGPQLTRVAFQGEDGIWYAPKQSLWNDATHSVTVETTHFSDWTTFDELILECASCKIKGKQLYDLKVEESAEFRVRAIDFGLTDDGELSSLVDRNRYDLILDEWFANGVKAGTASPYGTITPNSKGCTYTAPNKEPPKGKNPVSLMVTLKNLKYKDPKTGAIFNDLQLVTNVNIVGDAKYELVIKYFSDDMFTGGLVGAAFIVKDSASIQVLAKADGSITCSEFVNSPGVVIPTSKLDPSGNKSTCTSDTFLGPIDVTTVSGLWDTSPDGKRVIQFIVTGNSETPAFDWVGALGGKASFPKGTGGLMQIFFFDIIDGNPVWRNTNDEMTAKLVLIE